MNFSVARLAVAIPLLVAGCAAGRHVSNVDARLFLPEGVQRMQLQQGEYFLMPVPIDTSPPAFPGDIEAATLPPTTVCIEIVVGDEGTVTSAVPLRDQEDCSSDQSDPVGKLMAAAVASASGWTFFAAGICTPATPDDDVCERQDSTVRSVPVKLAYAFTFERSSGKAASVRATALAPRRAP